MLSKTVNISKTKSWK